VGRVLFTLAALAIFPRHHRDCNEDYDDRPRDLHEAVCDNVERSQKKIEPQDKQEHWFYHVMAAVACFAHFVIFHFCV
jgi:hypothetical protein